jgi:hypothetical protein
MSEMDFEELMKDCNTSRYEAFLIPATHASLLMIWTHERFKHSRITKFLLFKYQQMQAYALFGL